MRNVNSLWFFIGVKYAEETFALLVGGTSTYSHGDIAGIVNRIMRVMLTKEQIAKASKIAVKNMEQTPMSGMRLKDLERLRNSKIFSKRRKK